MFGSVLKTAVAAAVVALVAAQLVARLASHERRGAEAPVSASTKPVPLATTSFGGAGRGEFAIAADGLGQYVADVEIDGGRVRMLVDTGASAVVLSYEDAAAVGFYPLPSDFKYPVKTANGVARVARVRLREARLGPLVVRDVEALVAERGATSTSLLGMTFLARLSRIEAGAGRLVLKQ